MRQINIRKQKQTHKLRKQILCSPKGKGGEWINSEVGINIYTPLSNKRDNQQGSTVSHRNLYSTLHITDPTFHTLQSKNKQVNIKNISKVSKKHPAPVYFSVEKNTEDPVSFRFVPHFKLENICSYFPKA